MIKKHSKSLLSITHLDEQVHLLGKVFIAVYSDVWVIQKKVSFGETH